MSSRPSTYPVSERRLKPVYEWLENGNNKKALQEAEKVLKKQPALQSAKVLKCLALIRLRKESESLELLESIKKEDSVDDAALQLMTVCYREINKPNLICDLYEWAYLKDPHNEEILTNLFLSYVRVADYKKQKSTALSLFKLKPKNQYYFWVIISLLIQTTENLVDLMPYFVVPTYYYKEYSNRPPPIENSREGFLTLANKMIEKHVNEKKIENDQEVLIYLIILEMQGKYEEALNIINGDLGEKLEYSIAVSKKIDLYLKMKKWSQANELLRSLVLEDLDAWNYIVLYLDTVFELGKGIIYDPNEDSCQFYKAKKFLEELKKENNASDSKKRGPYLAQLEFYSRLISEGHSKEKLNSVFFDCMVDYVREFGSKEVCVHDLRPYLHLVDLIKFLAEVCKLVNLKNGEYPKTKSQMNLHLTNIELCKLFGIQIAERIHSVNNMMQYFVHGLKFNNELQSTEPRSNDRYALLAIHSLHELWAETEDSNYLFEAITICNYALSYSPSNSQIRTLLLKFYHLLGGTTGAHSTYLSLDLKHMQLDTLGYLHVFPLLANAEYNHAKTVLDCTLNFFTLNFKESAEHITVPYKFDAFTKIPEFIHIRDKLNNSTHYQQATYEKMLLEIFSATSHSSSVQIIRRMLPIHNIDWSLLQDNRDFTVLWDVDPYERRLNYAAIQQTYLLDVVFLRLRSLLLQVSISSLQLGSLESDVSSDPDSSQNYFYSMIELNKLILELENNINILRINSPNSISNRFIAGPPQSRLILFIQCNYFDPIIHELKFLLCLLPGLYSNKESANSHLDSIALFFKEFTNTVSNELIKCDNPISRSQVIKMCAIFVEIVSFSCTLAGVCESVLKKFRQSLAKKNKKKKENRVAENQIDFDWRADVIGKYINVVSSYIKFLEKVLRSEEKSWKERNLKMGEISVIKDLKIEEISILKKISQQVNDTLNASYYNSVDLIATALKLKLKYISSHKL